VQSRIDKPICLYFKFRKFCVLP